MDSAASPTPLDDDLGQPLLKQLLDVWVEPEIRRRQEAGLLPRPALLRNAQVVMNVDRPTQVRLNEEVRVVLTVKVSRTVNAGDLAYEDDLADVHDVQLTDADPNAGHMTALLIGHRWLLAFDFRYNAAHVAQHLAAAKDYLASSKGDLDAGRLRPFTESLFGAVELSFKAWLLMFPEKALHESRSHKAVASRIGKESHIGNVFKAHCDLLHTLQRLRPSARYLNDVFDLEPSAAAEMLATGEQLFEWVRERAPQRLLAKA